MTFSDEDLMAYADGELDDQKRQQIREAINRDPEIARRVESHRALKESLRKGFDPVLQEPVPDRLVTAARSQSSASKSNVVPLRGHKVPARPQPRWIALAASFILGALALQFGGSLLRSDSITERDGQMLAAGNLRDALSNQLAASQTPSSAVQIGVSFLSHNGHYCRTFQLHELGGLACNDGGNWKLEVLARENHAGNAEYRPAASSLPPAVVQAVTDTISGEPLDAKGESSARAQKWQK
jgi:hypothetical protein